MILGFLGSLYDTSTVIDLVHAADLYLWGGAGFGSGKVSYLWTQRDELFKSGSESPSKGLESIVKASLNVGIGSLSKV